MMAFTHTAIEDDTVFIHTVPASRGRWPSVLTVGSDLLLPSPVQFLGKGQQDLGRVMYTRTLQAEDDGLHTAYCNRR